MNGLEVAYGWGYGDKQLSKRPLRVWRGFFPRVRTSLLVPKSSRAHATLNIHSSHRPKTASLPINRVSLRDSLYYQATCSETTRTLPAFFGASVRDTSCRSTHINLRVSKESARAWIVPTRPTWMTEARRRSNGTASVDMAEPKELNQSKDARENSAPKASSPIKHKASSTGGSEAPGKPAKKRRKVNHGKAFMLCSPQRLHDPANI